MTSNLLPISVTCCGRVTMKEFPEWGKVNIKCWGCGMEISAKHSRIDPMLDKIAATGLNHVELASLQRIYLNPRNHGGGR